MKVTFNSWQAKYKRPFGALAADNEVALAVGSNDQAITAATLWLTKTGGNPVAYPMAYDQKTQMYTVKVKITSSGLYHYYFAFQEKNNPFYLQCGSFGQGVFAKDKKNLKQFQLTCYDKQVPSPKWYQEGVAYQIFPDRFANGNPHKEVSGRKPNTFLYATEADRPYYIKNDQGKIARWDFFGGNLKGIIKKIPYLKKLGVTCLYLNPIFLAKSNHRYDTMDFMKIDPMLGTETDLRNLVQALHENNMHLILDGVFNHVGRESIYFQAAIKDNQSPYYSWFNFINYPNKYRSWWGVSSLPEVNKGNAQYQNFIYGPKGVLAKWTRFKLDGWRLDVADELPMPFLRHLRERLEKENCQLMIGEVWEDASHKFVNSEYRPYTSGDNLTGVMNYPVRNFIVGLLTAKDSQTEVRLMDQLAGLIENYPSNFLLNCMNNIGTHDTPRIKTVLAGKEKLVAFAFGLMFMLPGVPCIYYGDEAGLSGGKDPDNRRYFPWGHESQFLKKAVASWAEFRRHHSLLIHGKIAFVHANFMVNGLIRYNSEQALIYLFNRGSKNIILDKTKLQLYCLPNDLRALAGEKLNGMELATEESRLVRITKTQN